MFSTIDERKGIVKTDWTSVRQRVGKVEPYFAKLVDQLSPNKDFHLYLAYMPYGDLKGDTQSTFIPRLDGGSYRLTDPDIPNVIAQDLKYGRKTAPLGLVLEKTLEMYWDLPKENITIPKRIYTPGKFLSILSNINSLDQRKYMSNKMYSVSSGSRSVFMLPNIGREINHNRLRSRFNVKTKTPKFLYEEWIIFKQIIDSEIIPCDWCSCVLYFSEKWIDKLHSDSAWHALKIYLHEVAWSSLQYDVAARSYYDSAFSMIQKQNNLKPNPYLVDTAKHLFSIALGDAPGYAPACDNESLPIEILQKAYVEAYGLKKYFPTIMRPQHFSFEKEINPVYYSLHHPSTHIFSPKSRRMSSTLHDMRELEDIAKIFTNELSQERTMCSDTVLGKIAKGIEFKYFHNESDPHKTILRSEEVGNIDQRFNIIEKNCLVDGAKFASDAPFLRGCISIKSNNQ